MRGRGGVLRCLLAVWLLSAEFVGVPVAAAAGWEGAGALNPGRGHLAAVSDAGGRVYAIGGVTRTGSTETTVKTVQRYDPEANAWVPIASLDTARRRLMAARGGDGRIYAFGGFDADSRVLGSVEVYDPDHDRWETLAASMSTPRADAAVATGQDGRIYVFGGRAPGTLDSVEVFDPAGPSWSSLEPMPRARWGAAAATGPDGQIYVIGGEGASGRLTAVDIYDPASDTWTTGPALPAGRRQMGAATGADGRIYVVGGEETGKNGPVDTVLTLDPGGDMWQLAPPLAYARHSLGVTSTPAGVIFAVGGVSSTNSPLTQTERYATESAGDGTPPVTEAALDGPAGADGWFTDQVTVTLSASDDQSGVESTTYRVDGGGWHDYMEPFTIAGDGTHTLEFFSTDLAGNAEDPQHREVWIDGTPPTITGQPARPPDANGWYRSPVDIVFTCTDDTSGVAACPDPVTLDGEGRDLSVQRTAVDRAGNTATTTVGGINIDGTPPDISVALHGPDDTPVHPNESGWFAHPVTVVFTCADTLSDVLDCPAPQVLTDGAGQRIAGVATDYAGNTASAEVEGINVDTVPPSVTVRYEDLDGNPVAPSGGWYPGPLRLVFTCTDDGGSGVHSCPEDRTLGAGAGQSVSDVALDHAGNQTPVEIDGINVAGPAPSIDYALVDAAGRPLPENPSGWYDQPVTVAFTCSGGTGEISVCGPDVMVDEGDDPVVTGVAVDEAGNRAEVTVGPIYVDRTPPSIDCQPPAAGWYGDNVAVSCTAQDAGSGLADLEDAAFTLHTAVPDGAEVAAALTGSRQVCDLVGHCATAGPYQFGVDRRAPTIEAAATVGDEPYLPGAWVNQPVTVRFSCVDAGAGLAPGSPPAPVTRGDDGAGQSVTGTCVDLAGNQASLTVDGINIDRTAPVTTVEVAGPLGDAGWYRGTVTATLAATDEGGSGLAGIRYRLDDGPAQSYGEPLTIDAEGVTPLTVWSSDGAGNVEAAQTVEVRVDSAPPVVTCEEPDTDWYEDGVVIACTAVDTGSGLRDPADASFVLMASAGEDAPPAGGAGSTRTVCDVAGNCVTAGPISLPVDTQAPRIEIAAPAGTYLLNQDVAAGYSCADDDSGLVACDGPVPSGARIDTSQVGRYDFTVAARDAAGNVASQTATYQVRYGIESDSRLRFGPLVWLRLRLVDADGANHSAAVHRLRVTGLTADGGAAQPKPLVRLVYVGRQRQGGEYLALVTTWRLPSGTHTLWFTVDDDPVPYAATFSTAGPGWGWPWIR